MRRLNILLFVHCCVYEVLRQSSIWAELWSSVFEAGGDFPVFAWALLLQSGVFGWSWPSDDLFSD